MLRGTRRSRPGALVALVVALGLAGCASPPPLPRAAAGGGPGFAATLGRHLCAVEGRDRNASMATVSEAELMLLLPDGKVIGSRGEFEAMHRAWFADPDWAIKFRVGKVVETAELADAVATDDYEERTPGGPPRRKRRDVELVFRKYDAGWRLVHDQNAPLEGAG